MPKIYSRKPKPEFYKQNQETEVGAEDSKQIGTKDVSGITKRLVRAPGTS